MPTDHQTPFIAAYLQMLEIASAVKLLPGMESFGIDEKALFDAIMLAWGQSTPMTVRQAIGINGLGSPATLHKRLTRLRAMELVTAVGVEGDRRTKFLGPTAKGLKYSEQLGQAFLQLVKSKY